MHKTDDNELQLKYYNSVVAKKIDWLWYPYIPSGKITIIQGDPGEGKSTFILNLAALLTKGEPLPYSDENRSPVSVIYQNAEDGLEDTIKPRLENVGADCSKIAYTDYEEFISMIANDTLEQLIIQVSAKLLVLDPLQAFMGKRDMNRASSIRAYMSKLSGIAERTGCAIVLVGHMNKGRGGKAIYRGLGSIDITASARSILLIGRLKCTPNIRGVLHIKSNLAPEGKPLAFELSSLGAVQWIDGMNITVDDILGRNKRSEDAKVNAAITIITEIMEDGKCSANDCIELCSHAGISKRTTQRAKTLMGLTSEKIGDCWYWLSNKR